MRRALLVLLVLTLAAVIPARADDIDSANSNLNQATQDTIDARRQLDHAQANQRDAAFAAQNSISELQTLRTILDDPAAVQQSQAGALDAVKAVNDKTQALVGAQSRLDAAVAAADHYRASARATFESSPAFTRIQEELRSAQSGLDDATARSLLSLDQDPDFQHTQAMLQLAQARVKWLRDHATDDPGDLAVASRAWINAQNLANNYSAWWSNNDANILNARAELAAAGRDRDALNLRFQTDLAADPDLLSLVANCNVEQKAVELANQELSQATDARKAADDRARLLAENYNQAAARLVAVQQELDAAGTQIDQASSALDNADSSWRWAQDRQDRAALERDRALREQRLARDDGQQQRSARDRETGDRDNRDRSGADRDRDRQQRQADFDKDRNSASHSKPAITPQVLPTTPPAPLAPRHDPPEQRDPSPPQVPAPPPTPTAPRQDQQQQQQQRPAPADADHSQRDSTTNRPRDPDVTDRAGRYQR